MHNEYRCLTRPFPGYQKGLITTLVLLMLLGPLYAQAQATAEMPWGEMGMALFGGLALFLFGMEQMADALKTVAGERMKTILARLTANRFFGAMTGAAVTAVIQSSSVTTVLVVGFITANLMSLQQAIGVIMGANIGTTITAQIVAFKVTQYALPMIALGFGMQFFTKRERWQSYGAILMGLGMIFFGMSIMGDGMRPLRSYEPFLALMREMHNPLLGIAISAVFTALVQSSSATTGIVIVMATQGLIPLETGIALIFGANIGTCVTALLAAIGKPREAVRAALVHVLFNVAGVILWLAFIPYLAHFVAWFSPSATELSGTAKLAADVPRQIANAHTVFNLTNTLLFLSLTGWMARLVERMVPPAPISAKPLLKPRYLDNLLLETPSMALEAARREMHRMGTRLEDMLQEIFHATTLGDRDTLLRVRDMDNEVDALHGHIISYLGEISKLNLSEHQTADLMRLMSVVNELENIGDVIETNLVGLGLARIEQQVTISEDTRAVLHSLHAAVYEAFEAAIEAVHREDESAAREVIGRKDDINQLFAHAAIHQAQRLVAEEPGRLRAYTLEIDIIEKLKRVYYHTKRVAKGVCADSNDAALRLAIKEMA